MDFDTEYAYFINKEPSYIQRADVVLEVEGKQFPVHSALLENHSPVIHTLMEIARESSIEGCPDGKPSSPLPIKLFPQGHDGSHTVSSELFELFLCFIYRPSTPIKDKAFALQLLDLAELLQCDDVKHACDSALSAFAVKDGVSWERGGNTWERAYWELAVKHKMPRLGSQFLSSFLKEVMLRPSSLTEVHLDHAAQHALLTEFSKLNVINYVREQRPNFQPDVAGIEHILKRSWLDA